MGEGKGVSVGQILSWLSISMWEGVAHQLDACGPLCECLFAEYCLVHYVRKSVNFHYSGLAIFMGSLACQ